MIFAENKTADCSASVCTESVQHSVCIGKYVDGLYWIPRKDVDYRELEKRFTYEVEDRRISLCSYTSTHIGIPRAWGLKKFGPADDRTTLKSIDWPEFNGTYWEGQKEAIEFISDSFIGGDYDFCYKAPCGTGKCLKGISVAADMHIPVLVIVHKTDLADQWKNTARLFFPGCKVGHIQQNEWNYTGKHIVTVLIQTLHSRIDEIPTDLWNNFGLIIYDEIQNFPTTTFKKALRLPKCKFRLAVSATYRRYDGLETVIWDHLGKIKYVFKTERLTGRYKQILWKTNFKDKYVMRGSFFNFAGYITAIAENKPYNNWLAEQLVESSKVGRKTILVSDRISQLEYIKKTILRKGVAISVGMYVGSLDKKRLTKEQLQFAKSCDIILGTYKMIGEGTDIPELDTLFLGTPRSDIEQIVGRIQRKYEGKKSLLVVDPVFNTLISKKLAAKRISYYQDLGFRRER